MLNKLTSYKTVNQFNLYFFDIRHILNLGKSTKIVIIFGMAQPLPESLKFSFSKSLIHTVSSTSFFYVKKRKLFLPLPLAPKFENVWQQGEQRLCCAQTLKVRRINVFKMEMADGEGRWRIVEQLCSGRVHVSYFNLHLHFHS